MNRKQLICNEMNSRALAQEYISLNYHIFSAKKTPKTVSMVYNIYIKPYYNNVTFLSIRYVKRCEYAMNI